jgi:hypothetical protein
LGSSPGEEVVEEVIIVISNFFLGFLTKKGKNSHKFHSNKMKKKEVLCEKTAVK